ncbi:unnamed protein product [Callosobruchus maculatus]|uniref:Uncharacterized protein n=1 Tax=Callosobruchus maculatus TaxID=64391 RepID=A0A653D234_CALMS|nr:unnamed protein product [Callosobruchus maculatus]
MVLKAARFLLVGLVWQILLHGISAARYEVETVYSDCQQTSSFRLDVIGFIQEKENSPRFGRPTAPQYYWYQVVNSSIPVLKREIFPIDTSELAYTNIVEIKISNANISKMDDAVFDKFSALECIDLSGNHLTNIDRNALGTIVKLKYLDLSSNMISNLEPESFKDLTALNILNLSSNSLSSLNSGMFIGLSKLRELDLSRNPISTVDIDLCFEPLVALEKIYLREIENTSNLFDYLYLSKLLRCYKHLKVIHVSYVSSVNCSQFPSIAWNVSMSMVYFNTSYSTTSIRELNQFCQEKHRDSQLDTLVSGITDGVTLNINDSNSRQAIAALESIVSHVVNLNDLLKNEIAKGIQQEGILRSLLTVGYLLITFMTIIILILSVLLYKSYVYKYQKTKIRKATGNDSVDVTTLM